MSNDEQEDRLTALYGAVGLSDVMNGTLSRSQTRADQRRHMAQLGARATPQFVSSVDMDNAMTVSGIQAKILEYDPDCVLIDGAYLMQSELPKAEPGSPQALADIARNLKKLAQSQRIPIVVTTQADQGRCTSRTDGSECDVHPGMAAVSRRAAGCGTTRSRGRRLRAGNGSLQGAWPLVRGHVPKHSWPGTGVRARSMKSIPRSTDMDDAEDRLTSSHTSLTPVSSDCTTGARRSLAPARDTSSAPATPTPTRRGRSTSRPTCITVSRAGTRGRSPRCWSISPGRRPRTWRHSSIEQSFLRKMAEVRADTGRGAGAGLQPHRVGADAT